MCKYCTRFVVMVAAFLEVELQQHSTLVRHTAIAAVEVNP